MSSPLLPRTGGVLSADIAVSEHEREQRFYSRVLATGQSPFWSEDLTNNHGTPIIGLGERIPAYEVLPMQWMPHIQVDDVAASVERALALGGKALMRSEDTTGPNQWAGLLDPNGVGFGLIPVVSAGDFPPAEHASQGEKPQLGHISFLDLTVDDARATCEFYGQAIGWSVEEQPMEDDGGAYADYTLCGGDGRPAARIRHARGAHRGLPPTWLIHLPVGDLAESVRRVEAEGGEVVKSTQGADGAVDFAAIKDPLGVSLALIQG
ncbi:MAG: VOC family protein [Planctomycetota bacterium]